MHIRYLDLGLLTRSSHGVSPWTIMEAILMLAECSVYRMPHIYVISTKLTYVYYTNELYNYVVYRHLLATIRVRTQAQRSQF